MVPAGLSQRFSFDKPDDSLRDVPVIIVDQNNFEKIKPIVRRQLLPPGLHRMVWPNQDYFGQPGLASERHHKISHAECYLPDLVKSGLFENTHSDRQEWPDHSYLAASGQNAIVYP